MTHPELASPVWYAEFELKDLDQPHPPTPPADGGSDGGVVAVGIVKLPRGEVMGAAHEGDDTGGAAEAHNAGGAAEASGGGVGDASSGGGDLASGDGSTGVASATNPDDGGASSGGVDDR